MRKAPKPHPDNADLHGSKKLDPAILACNPCSAVVGFAFFVQVSIDPRLSAGHIQLLCRQPNPLLMYLNVSSCSPPKFPLNQFRVLKGCAIWSPPSRLQSHRTRDSLLATISPTSCWMPGQTALFITGSCSGLVPPRLFNGGRNTRLRTHTQPSLII